MSLEDLSRKRKILLLVGVTAGILLASLDANIVGTAMPKIISSLRGFDLYTWPITAYLLCMTAAMPLVGKLSDVFGFKPVYLFGIAIFLAGSTLCGCSTSMAAFIVFRGVQGIGVLPSCPVRWLSSASFLRPRRGLSMGASFLRRQASPVSLGRCSEA